MVGTNPEVRPEVATATVDPGGQPGRTAAVLGDQSLLIQCVDMLRERGIDVVVVGTDAPEIADWGPTAGVPIVANDGDLATALAAHRFDYLFSITNLKIVPDDVLAMAGTLAVNFHDGPLPAYAGLHATTWALLNGEDRHGVTWHVMESGVDEGDVLDQTRFDIAPDDTAYTLNVRCYEHAITSFARLVDRLVAGEVERTPQDRSDRSYFGRYTRPEAAATIDWTSAAVRIDALHRALDFGQHENPLARTKLLIGDRVFVVHDLSIDPGPGPEPADRAITPVGTPVGTPDATPDLTVVRATEPGTVLAAADGSIRVAAADGVVRIGSLIAPDLTEVDPAGALAEAGLEVGDRLPVLDGDRAARLSARNETLARRERAWVAELDRLERVELPYPRSVAGSGDAQIETVPIGLPAAVAAHLDNIFGADPTERRRYLGAAFACYLARLTGTDRFHLDYRGPGAVIDDDLAPWFAPRVPLACAVDPSIAAAEAVEAAAAAIAATDDRGTFVLDTGLRYPELAPRRIGWAGLPLSIGLDLVGDGDSIAGAERAGLDLVLVVSDAGVAWRRDAGAYPADVFAQVETQFLGLLEQLADPSAQYRPLAELSLLTPAERERVLVDWNDTAKPVELDTTLHALFAICAAERPDQTAVVFDDGSIDGQRLTYAELAERSDRLAAELRSLGAGPGRYVGVFLHRGADMIVGLLGILKSGAAYVPLDPTYPRDRIAFMIADADLAAVLTEQRLAPEVPDYAGPVLSIDEPRPAPTDAFEPHVGSGNDHAYLIYTSGSTGTPKGVMVTHANAVNFLAGMDDHITYDEGDTWLTVTSLSFDISVLEIFWSLTRGLTLVVYGDEFAHTVDAAVAEAAPAAAVPTRDISFSLFYFASDESEAGRGDKYELLMEGAKFADANGFEAVWTPERHFYAFGGLYPNPAVTSAAIAAVTDNVHIRAGSCVLPLHHPIRVAEEWSVVDNLSRGRTGIAFAAGWQPVDFVLRPENFADRKGAMLRDVDLVQRLWRGETIEMDGPNGPTPVRTLPRPVQDELPIWLTVAGNPDTFAAAGAGGHNVLTHLLGQSVDEVAEKIRIYRDARRAAGHQGDGRVTLMLHTLVGDDVDEVRDLVREPMKDYLRSSVALIKEAAWSFPTFQQKAEAAGTSPLDVFENEDLSDEEMDALLEHAFHRYFDGSALFGTPETCRAMVEQLRAIGVDEIACQVDFGVATDEVLRRLPQLNDVREAASRKSAVRTLVSGGSEPSSAPDTSTWAAVPAADDPGERRVAPVDRSIPGLIERHEVSHFQCTPSMGSMLVADDRFRTAAARLKMCLMGGEAFPQTLAKEITDIVNEGTVLNVYGPTETTIWSSCFTVLNGDRPVSIGTPLANQQMYVVDRNLQPTPIGVPGELLIGGDGVTEGLPRTDRELTDERFIPDHFRQQLGLSRTDLAGRPARLYRTGDLVRYEAGRLDRLPRPDGLPGQDPRLPDRAGRDRGQAHRAPDGHRRRW